MGVNYNEILPTLNSMERGEASGHKDDPYKIKDTPRDNDPNSPPNLLKNLPQMVLVNIILLDILGSL